MKLHTGDTVVIISGKDKGKTGSVMRVIPARNHVVVSGINMRTRHIKKTHQEAGRILRYEASLNASKVMLLDPKTRKPTRIGMMIKDGKKVRIAKTSGEVVRKVAAPKKVSPKKTTEDKAGDKAKTKTTEQKEKTTKAEKPTGGDQSKQPFWKRLQFGSAVDEVNAPDETRSKQDHTIPSQNIPPKTSGRGS